MIYDLSFKFSFFFVVKFSVVDVAIKRENYMAKQALKGTSNSLEDSDDDDNKPEVLE